MFSTNNHKYYNQKVYNNNARGTAVFIAITVLVALGVGVVYALASAHDAWSQAVSRTWSPGNNDTLISYLGGAVYAAAILGIILIALTILPFIIRLWAVQINALRQLPRNEGDDWRVIEGESTQRLPVEENYLIDDPHAEIRLLPAQSSAGVPMSMYRDEMSQDAAWERVGEE